MYSTVEDIPIRSICVHFEFSIPNLTSICNGDRNRQIVICGSGPGSGKLANAMKRVAAGADITTPWLFVPA